MSLIKSNFGNQVWPFEIGDHFDLPNRILVKDSEKNLNKLKRRPEFLLFFCLFHQSPGLVCLKFLAVSDFFGQFWFGTSEPCVLRDQPSYVRHTAPFYFKWQCWFFLLKAPMHFLGLSQERLHRSPLPNCPVIHFTLGTCPSCPPSSSSFFFLFFFCLPSPSSRMVPHFMPY